MILEYSINFRDSDEGDCFAGDGQRVIGVYKERKNAESFARDFNPILAQAEKENIVFPTQKNNSIIKKQFGFTVHDIDDGYNFKLCVEPYELVANETSD